MRYVHCPGGFEVYATKLQRALPEVRTPLVAMCADDDFMTGEGLAASVDFLSRHPDHSFSQGYAYTYQLFGKRLVVWPMPYDYHDVHEDSWIARVESPLSTVYYGVLRTQVLRDGVGFLAKQDFGETLESAAGFFDFCLTTYAARCGKFKRCPVPFGLREYSPRRPLWGRVSEPSRHATFLISIEILRSSCWAVIRPRACARGCLRVFARDYAGQIQYDLSPHESKKTSVRYLPIRLVAHAAYFL